MRKIITCWLPVLTVACCCAIALALAHDGCQAVAAGSRRQQADDRPTESSHAPHALHAPHPLPASPRILPSAPRKSLRAQVREQVTKEAAAELTAPIKAAAASAVMLFDAAAQRLAETGTERKTRRAERNDDRPGSPGVGRVALAQTDEPAPASASIAAAPRASAVRQETPSDRPKPAEHVKLPTPPKVAIDGPDRGTPGRMPVFRANVDGRYDALKWAVTPACEGLLILADPRQCTFGNDEPGEYTIRCTVSGGRQIAECEWVYEILDAQPVQDAAMQRGAPAPPRNPQLIPPAVPQADLTQTVLEQINKIQTDARAPEARAIGACFRDAANRFDTGQTPPGTDIAVEIFRCAKAGLGDPTVARWKPFFEWTALQLAMFQQAGLSPSGYLNQVALVMGQVQ